VGRRHARARGGLCAFLAPSFVAAALALGLAGCATRAPVPPAPEPALRLSEVATVGDPARRASMRLVLEGLDADTARRPDAARSAYERALQVDPNNPWAWLALARHEVEYGAPTRARAQLDKVEGLLPGEGALSRGAEPHVHGLRAAALGGGPEARAAMHAARTRAPTVWADGVLDARELR